jgi:serine/threonine-protein kinase
MIGNRLGHFRILDKIGAGGIGEVYRARDEQLERDVALTLVEAASVPHATARANLLRDARAASKLNHPNVCAIHEVGEADGQAYIAMEWVEGQPLSARLAEGPLRPDELLRYGLQLTDAVAYAHEHGVVHRDLKSGNVVVTPDGRVKVLGFGLARPLRHGEVTEATTATREPAAGGAEPAAGTLAYLAPEQLRGRPADARSDVWALGVLLQEMATGARPFRGTTPFELSTAILTQTPPPLPLTVGGELQAVIDRCLRKEPGERYRRASDVHAALEAMQSGTARPQPPEAPRSWTRRYWLGLAATGVVLVAVAGGYLVGMVSRRPPAPASASPVSTRTLAVLPLKNLSGDPNQQYVADGLTDALIDDLAKVVRVISRTSTAEYATAPKPIKQIARELGVDAVVEGAVLREGNLVRVTAALIDAATEQRLWGERYERNLTSILALQADIARSVARAIKGALSPEEEQRLGRTRDVNPKVWEAYQRGMFLLSQTTPDAFKKGMEYLHQAVEMDPTDALAYAGLANGYITLAHGPDPSPDALFRAKAAATTAIELDPTLPQAVFSLGVIKGYHEWDWAGGERDLRRAIELNESFAMAHYHLAWFLALVGRLPEAIQEHIKAREDDPRNPLHTAWLGELYRMDKQYDKAVAEVQKATELSPAFSVSPFVMSLIHADQGRWDQAVESMRQAVKLDPDWRWALGAMCAAAGRTAEARQILAELNAKPVDPWGALWRAVINAALGEKDLAFKWMNHQPHHVWLPALVIKEWEFFARPLFGDPRYTEQQRRFNVPTWSE